MSAKLRLSVGSAELAALVVLVVVGADSWPSDQRTRHGGLPSSWRTSTITPACLGSSTGTPWRTRRSPSFAFIASLHLDGAYGTG
jgi:hypothetical protein